MAYVFFGLCLSLVTNGGIVFRVKLNSENSQKIFVEGHKLFFCIRWRFENMALRENNKINSKLR